MRLPELCRLASMLRLFLTASSERRLVRGAKLGMLCLSSSEIHTHIRAHTRAHTQQLSPLRFAWKGKRLHAVTFPFMSLQRGIVSAILSHDATNESLHCKKGQCVFRISLECSQIRAFSRLNETLLHLPLFWVFCSGREQRNHTQLQEVNYAIYFFCRWYSLLMLAAKHSCRNTTLWIFRLISAAKMVDAIHKMFSTRYFYNDLVISWAQTPCSMRSLRGLG